MKRPAFEKHICLLSCPSCCTPNATGCGECHLVDVVAGPGTVTRVTWFKQLPASLCERPLLQKAFIVVHGIQNRGVLVYLIPLNAIESVVDVHFLCGRCLKPDREEWPQPQAFWVLSPMQRMRR